MPSRDVLSVEIENNADSRVEIAIFDLRGVQHGSTQVVPAGTRRVVLNVSGLEQGDYLIRTIGNDKTSALRFAKVN